MLLFPKRHSKKAGLPPGTLVHVGEKKLGPVRLRLVDYDTGGVEEKELDDVAACFSLKDQPTVTWVDITGVHDVEVIEKLGRNFDVHLLTLEDIVNTAQRPKVEDYDNYLYLILKMLFYDQTAEQLRWEQVSLVLGEGFLLSFQEQEGDVFDPVRNRIRKAKGRIRKAGADYLAYALVDAIVDHYFLVLEIFGDKVESLETALTENPQTEILEGIHRIKRDMITLRKQVWPLREVLAVLSRGESPLVHESTGLYLRDVYDHTIQVIDTIESLRDVVTGMLDIYLSLVSNRMNQVMKVLTIIATIFIPLTFLAGVYGMNFTHMPELQWRWAYPAVWAVMIVVGVSLAVYFKRKFWS